MFLFSFGTRPEIIKQFPLIQEMKKRKMPYKTLFTGQHEDLVKDFINLIGKPDYSFKDIISHGQSLNRLVSKIIESADKLLYQKKDLKIIVQGDTSTSFALALSGFQNGNEVIHIEAGLRTHNLKSPFPEEANRTLVSKLASFHFCPTQRSVNNLSSEGINENVYLVGNTIVDSFNLISEKNLESEKIKSLVKSIDNYIICTLHRRENRKNMEKLWDELNILSESRNIIYINHPSVVEAKNNLSEKVILIEPVNYFDMVYLIKNSFGVISDSGGIQEEVLSANKNILICRDTTERPETIESGFGKLIGTEINKNIFFLESKNSNTDNPYGKNVSSKIINVLQEIEKLKKTK